MKKILLSVFLSLFAVGALGQSSDEPSFKDYTAPVYAGKIRTINFKSHPKARTFRTKLKDGAKDGINFAGRYNLSTIGCGAGCFIVAIIDAVNGSVYFPNELYGWSVGIGDWTNNEEPVTYRTDSHLLRMVGYPHKGKPGKENYGEGGIYFYEWKNNHLKLVKFIKKADAPDK